MDIPIIPIPRQLTLATVATFVQRLDAVPATTRFLALDFSELGWLEPYMMLVLAHAVHQFRKRCTGVTVLPAKTIEENRSPNASYAAHMGLFHACGITGIGKQTRATSTSTRYQPIAQIDNPALALGDSDIRKLSLDLARTLTQETEGELVESIRFAFSEMVRNVAEHSQAEAFWYCAQYWPSDAKAEIALIDSGRGLRASLSANPHLRPHINSDRDALLYALMPGISSNRRPGQSSSGQIEENAGLGLYLNYRICNEGGSFLIASGNVGLHREEGAQNAFCDYHLPGVAIRMVLKGNALQHYKDHYHHLFYQQAKTFMARVDGGYLPTPDEMEKLLMYNFRDLA